MSDLTVGSTFAGCQLEAIAGRGGMGVVYRATQLTLGRLVAVKAMAADLAEDGEYRERFQRESKIAASIDHPNIIPVYEAGELEGTLYLIMRWVDGTDLRARVHASGRLGPVEAVRLLRPVASALSAAHRSGLVHRDIKPANVLLARGDTEEDEHVYLTDFGIARRTEGETAVTRTGVFVGTVDYAAPERIEGGKGDSTADIYSFGCMLFEAVTGHAPFERPSEVAKMFAHMNDPVPSARAEVASLPEDLDAIIAKSMAKDPGHRFKSCAELVAALGDVLHEMETGEFEQRQGRTAAAAAATTRPEPVPPATVGTAPATLRTGDLAPTAPLAPPSDGRPARRRRALLLAPLALLVIAGIVVALTAGGGSSTGTGSSSTSNASAGAGAVSAISGAGLSQVRSVALGGAPRELTVGLSGSVWASLPGSGAIVRVEPAGSRRFDVGGHPDAIAAGTNGIWVADSGAGALARFNARTGRVEVTAHLQGGAGALAVDDSDGSVWAGGSGGSLTHLDQSGTALGSPSSVDPAPVDMAVGEGWLWAVNGAPSGLIRVGGDGSPTAFGAGSGPVGVTLDLGVWTAHTTGHVTRFDPRPGFLRVNTDVAIAPSLNGIAAVEQSSSVWAISSEAKTLYRISTATGAPVTGKVTFTSAPVALAADSGGVWVGTQDGQLIEIRG